MEIVRRYWRASRDAVSNFVEEAGFRLSLAWSVLLGRFPVYRERRWWNRATETPILVDVEDWRDERLLFSILVWPSLESSVPTALRDQETRARQVKEAFGRVCNDLAWTTPALILILACGGTRKEKCGRRLTASPTSRQRS